MKNPDYIPPRAAVPGALDPNGSGEPDVGDGGSDYDLPMGWTFEHICNRDDCRGAVRRPLEGTPWPDFCSPECAEITARRDRDAGPPLPTSVAGLRSSR